MTLLMRAGVETTRMIARGSRSERLSDHGYLQSTTDIAICPCSYHDGCEGMNKFLGSSEV